MIQLVGDSLGLLSFKRQRVKQENWRKLVGGREEERECLPGGGHSMSRGPGKRNIMVCTELEAAWSCTMRQRLVKR